MLDEVFATRPYDEWAARFDAADVWYSPINSIADALADPQVVASGGIVDMVPRDGEEPYRAIASPVDFDRRRRRPGPVPFLGEHTDEVLDADLIESARYVGVMFVRRFAEPDTPALYDVCLRTADAGGDATHLHNEPSLLGHVWLGPYLALEPELAWVVDGGGGRPLGYVVGALDTTAFEESSRALLVARAPSAVSGDR